MTKLLEFLDGKKAKLLAIVSIVISVLTRLGYLEQQLAVDIFSILTILAGGTALATDKVLGKRNNLGQRIKYD